MTYRVIAFDLATTVGWALHEPGLERPFLGSERLPGGPNDVGLACYRLRCLMNEKHRVYNFTDMVFEDQFIPSQVNSSTARRLMGLAAEVETFCAERKIVHGETIRCYSIELPKWRKHFIGRGGGFKRDPETKKYLAGEDPKELAIRKCEEFGWHTDVADEAEAAGVLDYYLHLLAKADRNFQVPWRLKPLFGGLLHGVG